mgnify:CR=1 FL=1
MAHHPKPEHVSKTHGGEKPAPKPHAPFSLRSFVKSLGPGLITGASDDDPSGIGTYSQAGAQLGYGIGWTMLLTFPLMVAIQEISARVGRVTGQGISGNAARYYPAWLLNAVVTLLFIANTINIAAGGDRSLPRHVNVLLQPPSDEAPSASRNASGLINTIYQLRSNLFFTLEYRRLWTTRLDGRAWIADHVNIGGGIAF